MSKYYVDMGHQVIKFQSELADLTKYCKNVAIKFILPVVCTAALIGENDFTYDLIGRVSKIRPVFQTDRWISQSLVNTTNGDEKCRDQIIRPVWTEIWITRSALYLFIINC